MLRSKWRIDQLDSGLEMEMVRMLRGARRNDFLGLGMDVTDGK